MLFAAAAMAGGILIVYGAAPARLLESGIYTFGRTAVYQIVNVYAMKMAGVFMMTTCTIAVRTGIFPRWMALLGYAMALLLILSLGIIDWAPLAFPIWVLLISCHILAANLKRRSAPGL